MSTVLTVDFATLDRVIGPVIDQAKPILIRGKHGSGKSEVVYATAKKCFWNEKLGKSVFSPKTPVAGLKVVERRASQMTEGDLVGLPSINGNRTSFNPPDWFKEACENPVILFLDEIDRATVEVSQGIFELTDSRKLNGHYLHPGTIVFAAINGGKHAQQYQVREMDPAELDRWSVFDVEPSIDDWMKWAVVAENGVQNIHSTIVDFLNNDRRHLEHLEEYEPNKKYPSRRSWKRASDVLTSTGFLEEHHKDIVPLAAAFIGMEASIALGDFVKNFKTIVTPEDIIVAGKWKTTEKFSINEHTALIQKMERDQSLAKDLSDKHMANFVNYFITLPSECCGLLFKLIGNVGNNKNIVNFSNFKLKNGDTISDFMVSILTPQLAESEKK